MVENWARNGNFRKKAKMYLIFFRKNVYNCQQEDYGLEMALMKTCKEMASIWNVTERIITTFYKTEKIRA